MAIKRDSTDAIVSDVIREAADWTCERCSLEFPDRKSQNLHASHYYGRGIKSTRYHPDNVASLCGTCHKTLTHDHDEHYRFMVGRLGEVRYEALRLRKQLTVRYRNADFAEIRKHFREELKRLKALRADGVTGPISVVAFD